MNKAKMCATTLCYLEKDDSYLMMHRVKKKNDENKDKWIGVGGHMEDYESPEDCLLREVLEETGLTLTKYRFRGIVTFCLLGCETQYMFLYTATEWEGEMLADCREGTLEWIPKSEIYKLPLWAGDKVFFQLLEQEYPFFSLKLVYENDLLKSCELDGKKIDFLIMRADENDAEALCALEQKAYNEMPVKEWYVPDELDFFKRHISEEGFILKAVCPDGTPAGFLIVRYPGDQEDNLFFDICKQLSLPENEKYLTAHMESVAVDRAFRGNHLQDRLIREGIRIAEKEGYRHFCATVHPDNLYSRKNGEAAGFTCICKKIKYGGLERCICYKKI